MNRRRHARIKAIFLEATRLAPNDRPAFVERACGGERLKCTFNLSNRPVPLVPARKPLVSVGAFDAETLGPYAAVVDVIE